MTASPWSGHVCDFWELFSEVAGPKPGFLTPTGVPVRPVRAAGAAILSAADGFEAVSDLRVLRGAILLETGAIALKEQPPHEDHQTPEVVFVKAPDGPDQLSIDRHEQPFLGSPS